LARRSILKNEDGSDLTTEQFIQMKKNYEKEGPEAIKIKGFGFLKTSIAMLKREEENEQVSKQTKTNFMLGINNQRRFLESY